jgi:predicted XRE-type DNA-binding protein
MGFSYWIAFTVKIPRYSQNFSNFYGGNSRGFSLVSKPKIIVDKLCVLLTNLVYILYFNQLIGIVKVRKVELVSQSEFARLVDVSRQHINDLVSDGKLPMQDGKIMKFKALAAYRKIKAKDNESENGAAIPPKRQRTQKIADLGITTQNAKAEKMKYDAKLKQRQFEILEEAYIHVDQISNEINIAVSICRSKLLSLPNKLATELEGREHWEIESKLEDEINKCFTDLTELAEEYEGLSNNVKAKEGAKSEGETKSN